MLAYIDTDGKKSFDEYNTIEERNRIIEKFHNIAKKEMQSEDLKEYAYSIIDFEKKSSLVFVLKREVTETFSLTGY